MQKSLLLERPFDFKYVRLPRYFLYVLTINPVPSSPHFSKPLMQSSYTLCNHDHASEQYIVFSSVELFVFKIIL